jgi:hypothetical protein
MTLRKIVFSALTATGLAVAGLAATAPSASAYVVCNHDGDCWHTDTRYTYPGTGYVYHPDDWYFHSHWDDTHHWRDYHEGRGYWRSGVWVTF